MSRQVDILIIGGGLIGAALLLALKDSNLNILLVDANPFAATLESDFDTRSLALASSSVRILELLGLSFPATAIARISVSQQGRFGKLDFLQKACESLGSVVEIHHLNKAMFKALPLAQTLIPAKLIALEENKATIEYKGENLEIQAKLIVAADGALSTTRALAGLKVSTKDYEQQAIVANVGLKRFHENVAYERFTSSGPLALLPLTDKRCSLVWSLSLSEASRLIALSDKEFLENLQKSFGYRLGRFVKLGKRLIYPLKQWIMPKQTAWPLIFIGNAAHTLHPVAGQGFNLGLRDVASLAQCILAKGLSEAMLDSYLDMRFHDQMAIVWLTKTLSEIFTSSIPGLGLLRSLGLISMDNIPMLKNILASYASGFGGVTPDLACCIPLGVRS